MIKPQVTLLQEEKKKKAGKMKCVPSWEVDSGATVPLSCQLEGTLLTL